VEAISLLHHDVQESNTRYQNNSQQTTGSRDSDNKLQAATTTTPKETSRSEGSTVS